MCTDKKKLQAKLRLVDRVSDRQTDRLAELKQKKNYTGFTFFLIYTNDYVVVSNSKHYPGLV